METKNYSKLNDEKLNELLATANAEDRAAIRSILDARSRFRKNLEEPESTYFVAKVIGKIFNPTIVEKFDNKLDAESYVALMSRSKQANYIVLEVVSEWNGEPELK